jgi:hypothetical protein
MLWCWGNELVVYAWFLRHVYILAAVSLFSPHRISPISPIFTNCSGLVGPLTCYDGEKCLLDLLGKHWRG